MLRRITSLAMLIAMAAGLSWAQGLNTQANKNDWEEINFEFDSSVLVDGFPSLLRLAELLQSNPGNRVRIEGYTDGIGTAAYNQTLGLARANAVRDFLLKYGATAGQISTLSHGETAPRVANQGDAYRRTDEARYMNRRVALTVTDAQGNTIGAGSAGDAIRAINGQAGPASVGQPGAPGVAGQPGATGQPGAAGAATSQQLTDCCDQVLKRLDKLDEIAALLKDLADQNAQLRRDVDGLRQNQQAMQNAMQGLAGPGGRAGQPGQAGPAQTAEAQAPSAGQGGLAAGTAPERAAATPAASKVLQSLNFNVGADDRGKVAVSGRGRFFAPINSNIGFQAQGEYYYLRGQREGQFDFGLVDRFNRRLQAGLFGSFKTVSLTGNQTSGTLGQASFLVDYFFGRGKVGLFASKAFKDNSLINRANGRTVDGFIQRNIIEERYLKVVEQVGISSTVALMGNTYAEANIGYLRSTASSNRAGGTLRFVLPVNDRVAFTVEGGVNETFLPLKGTQQGRAAVGVRVGNFLRPKEYLAANQPVPMEIPRVRYETLTRRVRTGNDPPVADAGPDLNNISAGVVQLDGSNSYDPDGDPITYLWTQETGPTVGITNATAARASFTAALGQAYSFRLTVKDDQGGQSSARVRITARTIDRVQILLFQSDPRQVASGESANLSWRVLNADTVTISGLGTVNATGSKSVNPATTTTYVLTAKNTVSEETATATVVVTNSRFLFCFASPVNIRQGETTTLNWLTNGATGVTIAPGIGAVGANGSFAVTPTTDTTYTLTTTGGGLTDSCTIGVKVGQASVPTIVRFSADPMSIDAGEKSTLQWSVNNADKVSISTLGDVPLNGTRDVTPGATITYVLTATNSSGTATAQTTVTVNTVPLPQILSFTANPATIPVAGTPVNLTCNTTGAATVRIGLAQFFTANPTLEVFPPGDTTYTCIATNSKGQTATQTVSVKIVPATVPPTGPPPTINIAGGDVLRSTTRYLTLDASSSTAAPGNGPLTFEWTSPDPITIGSWQTATPYISLGVRLQVYTLNLKVTDAKGNSTSKTVTIELISSQEI